MPAQTLTSLIYRQEVEDEKDTEEFEKEEEKYSKENVRGSVMNATETNSEWGACRSEAWHCFSSNMEVSLHFSIDNKLSFVMT